MTAVNEKGSKIENRYSRNTMSQSNKAHVWKHANRGGSYNVKSMTFCEKPESKCKPGCTSCGYNWYARNRGNWWFRNKSCGCCNWENNNEIWDACVAECQYGNPRAEFEEDAEVDIMDEENIASDGGISEGLTSSNLAFLFLICGFAFGAGHYVQQKVNSKKEAQYEQMIEM